MPQRDTCRQKMQLTFWQKDDIWHSCCFNLNQNYQNNQNFF